MRDLGNTALGVVILLAPASILYGVLVPGLGHSTASRWGFLVLVLTILVLRFWRQRRHPGK